MSDFNTQIVEEFRANDGIVGGYFEGAAMVLLHHVGRNSGKASIAPLMYFTENDRTYIVASYAGADVHPAWYYNVLAAPSVSAEIGAETKSYRAVEVDRSERDRLYADVIVPKAPGFADYEKKTTRIIPVIELLPVD